MNINLRQVLLIIFCAIVLSFFRYFLLDDYSLLKKSKLNQVNISYETKNLYDLINKINIPTLIELETTKLLYDNNLVTFLDARDSESYNESHIKGAINLPYDYIDEIVDSFDLSYSLEVGKDFNEEIEIDNNSLVFGLKNGKIFISHKNHLNDSIDDRQNVFLIYCSGEGCSLSEDLGFYLFEEFGIKKIFIYEGGMPEWIEFNYPID